jgi:hypothetical protein
LATISVAVLSLARDVFNEPQANYPAFGVLWTKLSLYVATILAVLATATSGFDAVRMSAGGVDEDAFQRGWYSSMSLVLYVNSFTIYVAAGSFLSGLLNFVIVTQEKAVWIAVTSVWCLQMLVYILSFAMWCRRKR